MSRGSSFKSSWMGTFYFKLDYNISNMYIGDHPIRKNLSLRCFHFVLTMFLKRISKTQFKFICYRNRYELAELGSDYKIVIHCNINVFGKETKVIEMPSTEYEVEGEFTLKPFHNQYSLSNEQQRQFEFKISFTLIEYDVIQPDYLKVKYEEFCENYFHIFNNKSVIMNLCYILDVRNLEDVFRGRINSFGIDRKTDFIKRTADFANEIAHYWSSIKTASPKPFKDKERLSSILNYILHRKPQAISDTDLIQIYKDAYSFQLEFLKYLSRECILHRFLKHEISAPTKYETFMFEVLIAAVSVNDEVLLDEAEIKLTSFKEKKSRFRDLWQKLENTSIDSRFVIYALKQRQEKESSTVIRIEEASTSRV